MSVRPVLLGLYEKYFLPLQKLLLPSLQAFIVGLLPGLEEGSEIYDRWVCSRQCRQLCRIQAGGQAACVSFHCFIRNGKKYRDIGKGKRAEVGLMFYISLGALCLTEYCVSLGVTSLCREESEGEKVSQVHTVSQLQRWDSAPRLSDSEVLCAITLGCF